MKIWITLLIAVFVLGLLGNSRPPSAEAQFISKIVFVSNRDGNEELYIMDADGSQQSNLTQNPARDWHPAWSPDGARIAFTTDRDGNEEIYVMNPDGSGVTNLTNFSGPDHSPTWSPNSTQVAFTSERDGARDIYVMNADGSNPQRITTDGGLKDDAAWSPDGQKIAYWVMVNGQTEIFSVNVDGTGMTQLTNNGANDGWPKWSSDGLIMFDSFRDGNWEIYVMNADGTNPINLTHNRMVDGRPDWSRYNWQITFGSERDGNSEIYVMNADGTGLHRVTDNDFSDHSPIWQPHPDLAPTINGIAEFVQFAYTPDQFWIENPTTDQWVVLRGASVINVSDSNLPLDNAVGADGRLIKRLAPGECIYLILQGQEGQRPLRSCSRVLEVSIPPDSAFWLNDFTIDSTTDNLPHTCTAAQADRLTLCLMPR